MTELSPVVVVVGEALGGAHVAQGRPGGGVDAVAAGWQVDTCPPPPSPHPPSGVLQQALSLPLPLTQRD